MSGPHESQPVRTAGVEPEAADAAVCMFHGRGADARSMLELAGEISVEGVAYLAPQAHRRTWYPNSFMAPMESNEPHLSSALELVEETVDSAVEAGVSEGSVMTLGFSQGACLASEFLARNARRYGGHAALSGGLIGPEGTPREYDGDLAGTPVFLGCSDRDPHIPEERVHETADVFEELGADVTTRIYEGMGHTVNEDELDAVRELVCGLSPPASAGP